MGLAIFRPKGLDYRRAEASHSPRHPRDAQGLGGVTLVVTGELYAAALAAGVRARVRQGCEYESAAELVTLFAPMSGTLVAHVGM